MESERDGRPHEALEQMDDRIREFVSQRTWAIVGASNDPSKYGNRVYRTLRDAGYSVFPVNPNEDEIEGARAYPAVGDLPVVPDVVDLVVPPKIGVDVVRQCHEAGVRRVWFQPGAESEEAIEYCRQQNIDVVWDHCAMHHHTEWPAQVEA